MGKHLLSQSSRPPILLLLHRPWNYRPYIQPPQQITIDTVDTTNLALILQLLERYNNLWDLVEVSRDRIGKIIVNQIAQRGGSIYKGSLRPTCKISRERKPNTR